MLGARRLDRIRSLAEELTGRGGKALAVATDVTRRDQVERLVDEAVRAFRLTPEDLGAIESVSSNIKVEGARYPDWHEQMTGR